MTLRTNPGFIRFLAVAIIAPGIPTAAFNPNRSSGIGEIARLCHMQHASGLAEGVAGYVEA